MYWIEIKHEGLHKYRMIKGNDKYVVEQKAFIQKQQWDEMWRKKQEAERKKRERENAAMEKTQKKASAEQQTIEAINLLKNIEHTLLHTLDVDDKIDWNSLKDHTKFTEPETKSPLMPSYLAKPEKRSYEPSLGLFDKIFASSKQKKIDAANKEFEVAILRHQKVNDQLKDQYEKKLAIYEEKLEERNEKEKKFRTGTARKK